MAGCYRKVESAKERERRKAREERARKAKKKKRKLRFKNPERARKERRAKAEKIKGIGDRARELIESGLCPTCKRPASQLRWHHLLPRSLFPELIFDPANAFLGCDDPYCGHSLDRNPQTATPLSLRARITRINELFGFAQALYARRQCRGRLLDKTHGARV